MSKRCRYKHLKVKPAIKILVLQWLSLFTNQNSTVSLYPCFYWPLASYYYAPALIGGALSDAFVYVCLSRTSGVTREQRVLGRLKMAEREPTSHVNWTPISRSKGQRSLWLVVLAGQHGHTVMVTYPYVYMTVMSPLAGLGGAYRGGRPPTACSFK